MFSFATSSNSLSLTHILVRVECVGCPLAGLWNKVSTIFVIIFLSFFFSPRRVYATVFKFDQSLQSQKIRFGVKGKNGGSPQPPSRGVDTLSFSPKTMIPKDHNSDLWSRRTHAFCPLRPHRKCWSPPWWRHQDKGPDRAPKAQYDKKPICYSVQLGVYL